MTSIKVPFESKDIINALKELVKKACVKITIEEKIFIEDDERTKYYIVSFAKIPNCPKEDDDSIFSPTLQKLLLGIGASKRHEFLDVWCTDDEKETPSGGNLAWRTIHIDHRRLREGTYPMGAFMWVLVHELTHFYDAWKRFGWIPGDKYAEGEQDKFNDASIDITNKIRKEFGLNCYRYPDHGLEVFICKQAGGSLIAVEVGVDGKKTRQAPIEVGHDPNPIVPFTGGQRLAGPNTF